MSGYALGRRALSQLYDIERYTAEQWGDVQAERYVRRLFDTFAQIADRAIVSRLIPAEFGVSGQVCGCEQHFIY